MVDTRWAKEDMLEEGSSKVKKQQGSGEDKSLEGGAWFWTM